MFDTTAIGTALATDNGLIEQRPFADNDDGGRDRKEDDQHPQSAARLDDADLGIVNLNDVAFREGRQPDDLHDKGAAERGDVLQRPGQTRRRSGTAAES